MISYAPGFGDAYGACLDSCDKIDPSTFATTDAYGAAYGACLDNCTNASLGPADPHATTGLPPGVVATTTGNLPTGLTPPPGTYTPPTVVNWWRVGLAVALGLGVGIVLWNMRGADHAA